MQKLTVGITAVVLFASLSPAIGRKHLFDENQLHPQAVMQTAVEMDKAAEERLQKKAGISQIPLSRKFG